ncbi:class I SAM-dependent methyltransferase [Micromonospora sp. NPDC048830]|uniref:class I SAM-dependent methyltransferase n=1 Tax=Micromonospora sp. NPDC048830 TaxID=3364257 RepID=UPI003712514A
MSAPGNQLDNHAFEDLYRSDTTAAPKVPWDLGAPQPLVVALAEAGGFTGDVLDVGCGFGDNSMFLASRGLRVTGVDFALPAVQAARSRAAEKGVDVTFDVADATELDGYEACFDSVLDSALYHCLPEEERHRYVAALVRATRPGARLHLLCFSTGLRGVLPDQYLVSEENLRETIGRRWTIERLEPVQFTTCCTHAQLGASMRMIHGEEFDTSGFASLTTDDDGHVLMPFWQLEAVRAA